MTVGLRGEAIVHTRSVEVIWLSGSSASGGVLSDRCPFARRVISSYDKLIYWCAWWNFSEIFPASYRHINGASLFSDWTVRLEKANLSHINWGKWCWGLWQKKWNAEQLQIKERGKHKSSGPVSNPQINNKVRSLMQHFSELKRFLNFFLVCLKLRRYTLCTMFKWCLHFTVLDISH